MVEAGVEVLLLVIGSGHLYAAQIVVPFALGIGTHALEIPRCKLRGKVTLCAVHACGRKGNLGHQLLTGLEVECGDDSFTLLGLAHRKIGGLDYRTVEGYHKEIILFHPHAVGHVTGEG